MREGPSTELVIDALRNGVTTYAQLAAFLATLLGESRRVRFIADAGEVLDHTAPIALGRILCLYSDSNAPATGGISIAKMENFYYQCTLGTPDAQPRNALDLVKAFDVPLVDAKMETKTAPRKAVICKNTPKKPVAAPMPARPPRLAERASHITRQEEALLLSSDSELQQTVAAVRRSEAQPILKEDGRVDLAAMESSSLEAIRLALEGRRAVYREIMEEEGCPVISAEKSGVIEAFVSKETMRVKDEESLKTHLMRLDTLYSLAVVAPTQSAASCAVEGCTEAAHALFKQVNFYFSEKNYAKDEFIQAHVARGDGTGMDTALLLNFPRVRRMGIPLARVRTILEAHQHRDNANYAIHGTVIARRTQ